MEHRRACTLAALTAASLTKLLAAPLLIVCLLAGGRRSGLWPLIVGAVIVVGVGTLVSLPYSVYTPRLILFLPGFLGIVLIAGHLGPDPTRLVHGLVAVSMYAAALLSPSNKPWYLLVLIGLLAVVASGRITAAGVVVCATTVVISLLPLQPGIGVETYWIFLGLLLMVQVAALIWAYLPQLQAALERGFRFTAHAGLDFSTPGPESSI